MKTFVTLLLLSLSLVLPQAATGPTRGNVQHFETMAEMKASAPPQLSEVFVVKGLVTAGDGGGGTFIYDKTSVATADGTVIVQLTGTSGAGRLKRMHDGILNLKWWASGDLSTDDTAGVDAAFAYFNANGGSMFIPRGTYRFSNTIRITHPRNWLIRGEGKYSRLEYTGTGTNAVWIGMPDGGVAPYIGIQNIHLCDLTICGNATTVNALVTDQVHRSMFSRLRPRDCTGAAFLSKGGVLNVYDNIVTASDDELFAVEPANMLYLAASENGSLSYASIVRNCTAAHLTGYGIRMKQCALILVTGGSIEYCAGGGIETPSDVSMNTFENIDLEFNGGRDFEIHGHMNQFRNNGSYGTNWVSGRANHFIGGNYHNFHIFAGASRTLLENVSFGYGVDRAFVDEGEETQVMGVWDAYSDQFNQVTRQHLDEYHARWKFWGGMREIINNSAVTITNMVDGAGTGMNTTNLFLWLPKVDAYAAGIWNRGTNSSSHALNIRSDGDPASARAINVTGHDGLDKFFMYSDGRSYFNTNVTFGSYISTTNISSPSRIYFAPGGNLRMQLWEDGSLLPPTDNFGNVGFTGGGRWSNGAFYGLTVSNLTVDGLFTFSGGINASNITAGTITGDRLPVNDFGIAGIVPAGGPFPSKLWATDETGTPAWRDPSSTLFTDIQAQTLVVSNEVELGSWLSLSGQTNRLTIAGGALLLDGAPVSGAGDGTANWTGAGTTNSSLAGIATVHDLTATNLVTASNVTATASMTLAGSTITAWPTGSGDFLSPLSAAEIAISSATTATISRMHECTATSADYSVTLPAVSGNTGKFIGFRIGSGSTKLVTLDGNASEDIDGELTRPMWKGESAVLYCNGTAWRKISGRTIPMVATLTQLTTGQSITASATTKITFNTVNLDPSGMVADDANDRMNIKRKGIYRLLGNIGFAGVNTSGRMISWVEAPSGTSSGLIDHAITSGDHANVTSPVAGRAVSLNAGDTVELFVQQTTSGSQTTRPGNENCLLHLEEVVSW